MGFSQVPCRSGSRHVHFCDLAASGSQPARCPWTGHAPSMRQMSAIRESARCCAPVRAPTGRRSPRPVLVVVEFLARLRELEIRPLGGVDGRASWRSRNRCTSPVLDVCGTAADAVATRSGLDGDGFRADRLAQLAGDAALHRSDNGAARCGSADWSGPSRAGS